MGITLPLKGIPRLIFTIATAFIFTAIFASISALGIPYIINILSNLSKYITYVIGLIVIIVFICTFGTVPFIFRGVGLPGPSENITLILSFIGITCFLLVIPALVIYWITNPSNYKKAIQIGVFLVSTGLSVVYYLSNRRLFEEVGDTVSFFAGTCLGPPAVIEILL